MSKNEQLLEAAKQAVTQYHEDTSVTLGTTLEGLRTLQKHIESQIIACETDIDEGLGGVCDE